jgi:hypothetical protein
MCLPIVCFQRKYACTNEHIRDGGVGESGIDCHELTMLDARFGALNSSR